MTKLEEWEKEKKILSDFELSAIREIIKRRGQTRTHFQDSKRFVKYMVRSQNYLKKVVDTFKGNYSKAEAWLEEHGIEMSDDTIRKYVHWGNAFEEIENKIDKVTAQKGITRPENEALKQILRSSVIERKGSSFDKLLNEVLEWKNKHVRKVKGKEETSNKGEWKTKEEEQLESMVQGDARPKSALEPFKKARIERWRDDRDAKGKPLSDEGKRIKELKKRSE